MIPKAFACFLLLTSIFGFELHGEAFSPAGLFDLEAIRDEASLETEVLVDWRPLPGNSSIRQKLVEITVCEWWPGQRVRIPVTFVVPSRGEPCENVLLINMGLGLKPGSPKGVPLELLIEKRIGLVMVGMGVIEAMKPVGQLHDGMREQLLKTKKLRYTTAWIWGASQMRGLTAAIAEQGAFRPKKVLATGGSKRGIASAVAGIHDDRFTAIMPVVAPPLGNPGGEYVTGSRVSHIDLLNKLFFDDISSGKLGLDAGVRAALEDRAIRRANTRITVDQARDATWTEEEIRDANDRVWDASRIVRFLPQLNARRLDYFYNVGTNDSVTPALLELGKEWPEFPINIVAGGQHGGPATAGYTRRVTIQPEVEANLKSFALNHFFDEAVIFEAPSIASVWNEETQRLEITAKFSDGSEPDTNELWWTFDKSMPYTLAFEYDTWESVSMKRIGAGLYGAEIDCENRSAKLDYLTSHTRAQNSLSWKRSSPYQRFSP